MRLALVKLSDGAGRWEGDGGDPDHGGDGAPFMTPGDWLWALMLALPSLVYLARLLAEVVRT